MAWLRLDSPCCDRSGQDKLNSSCLNYHFHDKPYPRTPRYGPANVQPEKTMPSNVQHHEVAMIEGLTRRYADHAAKLQFEDVPGEAVEKAKLLIRDGLGNQIAASAIAEPASQVVQMIKEWGGAPQATVVGYGYRFPAPLTTMCNAMLGHGVELDDAHGAGLLKGGSVMVPSAFAAAEMSHASGKDVIAAIVAGYDVAVRVAKAINPAHRKRGFHTTGTVSTLGSAVVASKLLGGDAEVIANAIGLAAMQSAGIQSYLNDPCLAKPFSPGKAAFNGMIAALMASRGFTGPKTALECREGFLNAYADEVDYDALVVGLGDEFSIMEVGFKPHAACRYAHGPLDLAQALRKEHNLTIDKITAIEVEMSEMAIRQASKPSCANLNVAMGSTEFGVLLALKRGSNGLRDYMDAFEDRALHDRLSSVTLTANPDYGLTGRASAMRLTLADGTTVGLGSKEPRGEPGNPLSSEELEAKFKAMASIVLNDQTVEVIARSVMDLDEVSVPAEIVNRTVAPNGKPDMRAA